MIQNFGHVFFANLKRQKFIAGISIIGLAVGFTVCILFSLYVRHELSYERQWDNADRLVRVLKVYPNNPEAMRKLTGVETAAMPLLLEYFPEQLEAAARTFFLLENGPPKWYLGVEEVQVLGGLAMVEPDYFKLFNLQTLRGSLEDTLAAPGRMALPDDMAAQIFGTADPMGKLLSIEHANGERSNYEVTAVYKKPAQSYVNLLAFTLLDAGVLGEKSALLNTWDSMTEYYSSLYLLLKEGVSLQLLNAELDSFVDQHVPIRGTSENSSQNASDFVHYELQKLTDIHFHPLSNENVNRRTGDIRQVVSYAVLALLVLLIGVVNYSIVAFARSVERRRELAVRKVSGAGKAGLFMQYTGESMLYSVFALLAALAMTELLLPGFSKLTGVDMVLDYREWSTIAALVLMTLLAGICGGIYPALVLSRLKPQQVFWAGEVKAGHGVKVRSLLIGFQYSMTIMLLVATLVIYFQLEYLRKRDMGFNPHNIMSIGTGFGQGWEAILNDIETIPGVLQLSHAPSQVNSNRGYAFPATITNQLSDQNMLAVRQMPVGERYFDLYQIELLAGRLFDEKRDISYYETGVLEDDKGNKVPGKVVINEALARALGYSSTEEALQQTFWYKGFPAAQTGIQYQIIGVVADSQILDARKPAEALYYSLSKERNAFIQLRYVDGAAASVRAEIARIWQKHNEPYPPSIELAEENLRAEFQPEANEGRLLLILSVLSITVSCLGLYGVVAFETRRRVKEIGIRKVLGADVRNIVVLFVRQFSLPVVLANAVAWPLALWAMLQWLQRFPYQIDSLLLLPLCLLAGTVALLIAALTVGMTTKAAADRKPVSSLRYE